MVRSVSFGRQRVRDCSPGVKLETAFGHLFRHINEHGQVFHPLDLQPCWLLQVLTSTASAEGKPALFGCFNGILFPRPTSHPRPCSSFGCCLMSRSGLP